ncbi:sulfotransferase [Actibacterium sp.]|jgi:hypothetical protein|uniref:sulfotransferase n=1 Tax=Actibacterium sp. TaxID=1872125 RepID=UPI00257E4646|nr:sulfotransferase [Actibacterium sp.]|tara:strand:- start:702 stop:1385 length:684 start_codon:yes stop_codon:yes gene_type:complete
MQYSDFEYIFIITYARSGSTLLQSLINSADGVQIRGENNNALFHLFLSCAGLRETSSRGRWGQQSQPDEPWYGAGEVDPEAFAQKVLNSFVEDVLKPAEGKRTIGFKEIRHTPYFMGSDQFSNYMSFLETTFPNARIVFNSRTAQDVANSAWLKQEDPKKIIGWVNECDRRFANYAETSDRAILMRYDDYVKEHDRLEELFSFLGLPFDRDKVEEIFDKPLTHAKKL